MLCLFPQEPVHVGVHICEGQKHSIKLTSIRARLATAVTLALPTQAATFEGYDKLCATNDLTVIDDNGTFLEFLDISRTRGTSVSRGPSIFGRAGFALATYDQPLSLFDAFSITNNTLSPTVSSVTSFNQALGVTHGLDGSLGSFDSGQSQFGFYCISIDACGFGGTYISTIDVSGGSQYVGITLVRGRATMMPTMPVPLSAGLPLVLAGLGALALLRRRT